MQMANQQWEKAVKLCLAAFFIQKTITTNLKTALCFTLAKIYS